MNILLFLSNIITTIGGLVEYYNSIFWKICNIIFFELAISLILKVTARTTAIVDNIKKKILTKNNKRLELTIAVISLNIGEPTNEPLQGPARAS